MAKNCVRNLCTEIRALNSLKEAQNLFDPIVVILAAKAVFHSIYFRNVWFELDALQNFPILLRENQPNGFNISEFI